VFVLQFLPTCTRHQLNIIIITITIIFIIIIIIITVDDAR